MIITRAAIMFSSGEIFEGQTYSSIISIASKLGFTGEKICGFVTSSGDFVLPQDAVTIALKAKQISNFKEKLEPEDIRPNLIVDAY